MMTNDRVKQNEFTELRLNAEKTVSLSLEDFRKIPDSEVQKLIGELVRHMLLLETQVEQLRTNQQELEATRKQTSELFDYAPIGYFILDKRGYIDNVNITAIDMFNTPRNKLVGMPFLSVVEPKSYDAFRSYLKDITETGSRASAEIEMRRGDGTTFHAQLQTIVLYQDSNMIYRVSAVDITGRKMVEQALKESEQKYRELADMLPEIMFEADNNGKLTYANRKALESFNIGREEQESGINIFNYITPESRSTAEANFRMVLKEGDIGAAEYVLKRRDGAVFPALVHTARIMREGIAQGIRGIIVDITERKRIENQLAESENRYRSLFENMLDGFAYCQMIYDSQGKPVDFTYLIVNSAFERLTGLSNVAGKKVSEVIPGIRESNPELLATYGRVSSTGNPERFEIELKELAAWLSVSVYSTEKGRFVAVFDNITGRKKAEIERAHLASYPELSPMPVVELDIAGHLRYTNPAARALLPGLLELGSAHPFLSDWETTARKLQSEKRNVLVREINVGGRWYHETVTYVPSVEYFRVYSVEITERKKAEEALRDSERRFRNTLDNMLEGCQIIDFNWNYKYLNDAAARQGRRDKNELLGHTMMEMYPGIETTGMFARFRDCMEKRIPYRMDNEFTFPDGSKSWFELRIEPVPEGILVLSSELPENRSRILST
ncbi:MAG: PAS domain-containing protein [Dehalococcoidales bacterium]|nr:PAS domain-containing protein [Dehalococcoidales bacterium]